MGWRSRARPRLGHEGQCHRDDRKNHRQDEPKQRQTVCVAHNLFVGQRLRMQAPPMKMTAPGNHGMFRSLQVRSGMSGRRTRSDAVPQGPGGRHRGVLRLSRAVKGLELTRFGGRPMSYQRGVRHAGVTSTESANRWPPAACERGRRTVPALRQHGSSAHPPATARSKAAWAS
jgi:hypothetical protein